MSDSGGQTTAGRGQPADAASPETRDARVAVVGGGLAGLAAAAALNSAQCAVTLLESRRYLGGRATSFRDAASGEWVDLCQHVSMGCCTNLADFCRRTGIAELFRRERVLHFYSPAGRRYDLAASPGWPAPLHLAPSLWRLKYLSVGDRIRIGQALLRLARLNDASAESQPTIGEWLVAQGQSPLAIERFWHVVLVSALGESLDRASLSAARKVFVDGFMAAREAYVVEVPDVPLAEIYDARLRRWLTEHGVDLRTETSARFVEQAADQFELTTADGQSHRYDAIVLAVTWRQIGCLTGPGVARHLPWLAGAGQLKSSPISGVHLWFDRPIANIEHAVLVGRTSQWMFHRRQAAAARLDYPADKANEDYYYQVVISASAEPTAAGSEATIATVLDDLRAVFPAVQQARLLRARVVTDPHAVFSVTPESERQRPEQKTAVRGLAIAGDWTATGWPATMEGAVRSGYLAAEAILADLGRPAVFLCPDLPRSRLARWLIRSS